MNKPLRSHLEQDQEPPDIASSSDDYARRFTGEVGQWFLDRQADLALELLRPWTHEGATVLEIGGGHAQLTPYLQKAGFRVTIQGSSEACNLRPSRLLNPGSYEFVEGDLLNLPFADRSFTVVTALRLMAHMPAWPEFLAEMTRIADKAVLLDYPEELSMNFFAERLFAAKKRLEGNTRPFQCFRQARIIAQGLKLGFGRSRACPQFFWPMALHRGLNRLSCSQAWEAKARSWGLVQRFGSPVILTMERLGS